MVVTSKVNIFTFIFGKPHDASKAIARSASKPQDLDDTNLDEVNRGITITKSEDFYKTNALNTINPLSNLNR